MLPGLGPGTDSDKHLGVAARYQEREDLRLARCMVFKTGSWAWRLEAGSVLNEHLGPAGWHQDLQREDSVFSFDRLYKPWQTCV